MFNFIMLGARVGSFSASLPKLLPGQVLVHPAVPSVPLYGGFFCPLWLGLFPYDFQNIVKRPLSTVPYK